MLGSQINVKKGGENRGYLARNDPRLLLSSKRVGWEVPTPGELKWKNNVRSFRVRGQNYNDEPFTCASANAGNAVLQPDFRVKYATMLTRNRNRPSTWMEQYWNQTSSKMQRTVGDGYEGKAKGQIPRGWEKRLPYDSTIDYVPLKFAGALSTYKKN